eukprot:TRINITY_DN708_c0_g2_i1.p1 TRINITY_DN708_c0_g2~~TRINITY_DN708_c0_g2_i1.p1  ORF type:complete len:398 (+),score=44.49 TRINITY_DN708_c0_g2_i1:99-1292(+)
MSGIPEDVRRRREEAYRRQNSAPNSNSVYFPPANQQNEVPILQARELSPPPSPPQLLASNSLTADEELAYALQFAQDDLSDNDDVQILEDPASPAPAPRRSLPSHQPQQPISQPQPQYLPEPQYLPDDHQYAHHDYNSQPQLPEYFSQPHFEYGAQPQYGVSQPQPQNLAQPQPNAQRRVVSVHTTTHTNNGRSVTITRQVYDNGEEEVTRMENQGSANSNPNLNPDPFHAMFGAQPQPLAHAFSASQPIAAPFLSAHPFFAHMAQPHMSVGHPQLMGMGFPPAGFFHMHAPPQAAGPNIDQMSYDDLLQLSQRIGNVRSQGASAEQISSYPTHRFQKTEASERHADRKNCVICMNDFENGDELRTLHCFHSFHVDCIDNWLKQNAKCPVCRASLPS